MANQDAINQLRQNNWRLLSQQKAVNNDIADMDVRQAKRMGELARLGAQTATKLMSQYDQIRTKNLESEAYNDFYQNLYPDYGNTEDAANASNTLMASQNSSAELHSQLGVARTKGLPGNIVSKIAEKHPVYGYTYAKLHLNKLGGRFASYMNSAMVKDETELTLPDVINPTTGLPHTFQIKNAKTLEEKMAAHRYLRGKYFTDNNIGAFGTAFLALPGERGGSDFFGTISAAENGKNGMFNKYAKEADIWETQQRIAMMGEAFAAKPDAITWQNFLDANMIGKDQNGNLITPEKALKNTDTFTFALIKAGQLDDEGIKNIADSIAPGTIQKTQNKKGTLTPIIEDGVIVGYGQTRAQKWPTRFSYKDGNFGTYMDTWQKARRDKSKNLHELAKLDFPEAKEKVLEQIGGAQDSTEAFTYIAELQREFGFHADFDYSSLYIAVQEGGGTVADFPLTRANILDTMAAGGALTTKNVYIPQALRDDPLINGYIKAEEKLLERPGARKTLDDVGALLSGYSMTKDGTMNWTEGRGSYAERRSLYNLQSQYIAHLKRGMDPAAAYQAVSIDYHKHGGGYAGAMLTMDMINAANAANEPLVSADGTAIKSNKYALDGNGNFVNKNHPGFTFEYQRPTEINTVDRYARDLGRQPLRVLEEVNPFSGEPAFVIEGETKETSNYNEILWNTRKVPEEIRNVVKAANKNGIPVNLTDVLNARLKAFGHPPLTDEVKELLGSNLVQFLDGGLKLALYGEKDWGVYKPHEISATVAKNADNPTALLSCQGCESFTYGGDAFGIEGPELNAAGAFFLSTFGPEAMEDLKDYTSAEEWSESFFKKYTEDDSWRRLLEEDIDWKWQMYGLTGDLNYLPLLPTVQPK